MRSLFHMPLDPQSRKIRLILAEKGLAARLVVTPPWDGHEDLARANPAMSVPVLIDEPPTGGEIAVAPDAAIAEYLEEAYSKPALMPATSAGRAEARRIAAWFDIKFEADVNAPLLRQRVDARLQGRRDKDPDAIRRGLDALAWHLDYASWLLEQRSWLAGDKLSIADLAAAAHLSASDYLGIVPWTEFPEARAWYQKMKSRPSMRPLLADRLDGLAPSAHYANPDF
ncbi:MAG: glutathione S-transferase family protein [Parvularculaceae bacterium]|nr:glutathione S-transferase family protein [Parvularculaceae bacterium]